MRDLTAYPFELRDSGAEGNCVTCTLDDQYHLVFMLQCLTTDRVIADDLQNNRELATRTLSKSSLPVWAKRWLNELSPGLTPVEFTVFGNGVTFYLILLVNKSSVRALWKHAIFDPN